MEIRKTGFKNGRFLETVYIFSYKIQRNLCVTLLRKVKRDYYKNLELGKVNDSEKTGLWKQRNCKEQYYFD